MSFDTYANLSTALGSWEDRTFTTDETDEFLLLVEAKANRRLARHWNRQATSTVGTDAEGYGTLPTGFLGLASVKRDLLGATPLTQVAWEAIDTLNPNATVGAPRWYAISGTEFRVAPVCEDDFILTFDKKVAALSASNTSNWLLALAPDYYLFGGQAAAAAKWKSYQEASLLQAQADAILDELVGQANVAQLGNAELVLPGVTP
jgi:hypothetical protein